MCTGRHSVSCSGSFELELHPAAAIALFTPEGERAWVDGWDPSYPDPDANPDAAGTAFTTGHGGAPTTWLVTVASANERRYARIDPHGIAATIEVRCTPAATGTRVEIVYTMTAVEPRAAGELERFAAGYDAYLESWQEAIEAAIERGAIPPADA